MIVDARQGEAQILSLEGHVSSRFAGLQFGFHPVESGNPLPGAIAQVVQPGPQVETGGGAVGKDEVQVADFRLRAQAIHAGSEVGGQLVEETGQGEDVFQGETFHPCFQMGGAGLRSGAVPSPQACGGQRTGTALQAQAVGGEPPTTVRFALPVDDAAQLLQGKESVVATAQQAQVSGVHGTVDTPHATVFPPTPELQVETSVLDAHRAMA